MSGVAKRFASAVPIADKIMMNKFKDFVYKWCKDNLTPLPADSDCSVETWLKGTNYPLWRKKDLQNTWDNFDGQFWTKGKLNKYTFVKSFIKDESYTEYKHARGINSRRDEFKVRVGPIFKLIEKEVFKSHWFIKYVPMKDRMRVIMEELHQEAATIAETDHSSFEAHFTPELMECCEFVMYDYMTQNLPDREWINLVREALGGINYCHFKWFIVEVLATRMSGEMCTSLGNGFTNLMVALFMFDYKKCRSVKGKIEGDDGLFTFYGNGPTKSDFAKMGFTIKLEEHTNLTEASFCGILADSVDMNVVTDPLVELVDFGWTKSQYAMASDKKLMALLRAKSMSMAYQYPGCPVIKSLARYGLRVTEGYQCYVRGFDNMWVRDQYSEASAYIRKFGVPDEKIGINTRLLVERKFGLSVEDQFRIERYLDNKHDLSPIKCAFTFDFPPAWVDFDSKYRIANKCKDWWDLTHPAFLPVGRRNR